MDDATVNMQTWDMHAELREPVTDGVPSIPTRFEWTQFPGHGPAEELFGEFEGIDVVELGCGAGNNLAFLASRGARCLGIDVSPTQLRRARARWQRRFSDLRFIQCDAMQLSRYVDPASVDIIYSVFGAVGHSDPQKLFPQVHASLRRGGRFLFSVRHPLWDLRAAQVGEYGAAYTYRSPFPSGRQLARLRLPNGELAPVVRYQYTVPEWVYLANWSGFTVRDVLEPLYERPDAVMSPNDRSSMEALASATSIPCCLLITLIKR